MLQFQVALLDRKHLARGCTFKNIPARSMTEAAERAEQALSKGQVVVSITSITPLAGVTSHV